MDIKHEHPSIFKNERRRGIRPIAHERTIATDHTLIVCGNCPTVFFDQVILNAAASAASAIALQQANSHAKQLGHTIHIERPTKII